MTQNAQGTNYLMVIEGETQRSQGTLLEVHSTEEHITAAEVPTYRDAHALEGWRKCP